MANELFDAGEYHCGFPKFAVGDERQALASPKYQRGGERCPRILAFSSRHNPFKDTRPPAAPVPAPANSLWVSPPRFNWFRDS